MPFTAGVFSHLFDWEKDPQRNEKIVGARAEAELDGIDTGLSAIAAPQYVVLAATADLPNERVLTAGTGITIADAGAGGAVTINAARENLTASRTYYVRTDGSDSNTGLADSAGGAFLTWQKAANVISTLDLNGQAVTVQCGGSGSRTFTAGVVITQPGFFHGGGTISFVGDTTTPSNVTINVANPFNIGGAGNKISISGFKLVSSSYGMIADSYAQITISGKMDFGACTQTQMLASNFGRIVFGSISYNITGNSTAHMQTVQMGEILGQVATVSIPEKVAYGGWFTYADTNSFQKVNGSTFTGSTATVTIASPAVVSRTSHGLTTNDPVIFKTTGALPTGITAGTCYFVIAAGLTANAFQFSATVGGAAINTSGSQSGTHNIMSVSGQRYFMTTNAVIDTNGGGANYFPGSSAGPASPNTGGLYV